jgi:hypothetical protein
MTRMSEWLLQILPAAQQYSRLTVANEIGCIPVSLRDVERCVKLAEWLFNMSAKKGVC